METENRAKKSIFSFLTQLVPLFIFGHFAHHLVLALMVPLLPYIREEFALSYAQVGWLTTAFNFSYGISQLPAGWLSDKVGPRLMLFVGIAGVSIIGLFIGMSPTYIFLAVLLVLMGVAGGGYHPAAAPLVSASVTPEKRGRALGFHQIGGSVSFFVAPLIAAGIAGALGWRGTFISVSIPIIVFGILLHFLIGRVLGKKEPVTGNAKKAEEPEIVSADYFRLAVFLVLGITGYLAAYLLVSFIPLYMVDVFTMSESASAMMLAVAYSGGIWAAPLGGYLSDKFGKFTVIFLNGVIAAVAIYLFGIVGKGFGLIAALILLGMGMNLGMPVVESYIITHVPLQRRSTVLGLYYMGSRGGLALAPLVGMVIDNRGFLLAFNGLVYITVGVVVVSALLLIGGRRLRRNRLS